MMPNLLAKQIDIPGAFAPFIEKEFHTGARTFVRQSAAHVRPLV